MTRTTTHGPIIGRVGALAFFLGVGVALFAGAGEASADSAPDSRADHSTATHSRAERPATSSRASTPKPAAAAPAPTAAQQGGIGGTVFARRPTLAYNAAQNVQGPGGVITGTLNPTQAPGYR